MNCNVLLFTYIDYMRPSFGDNKKIVPHTEATTLTSLLFALHADAVRRTRAFSEALANMQGEDIMLGIYDNIHDELRDTRRRLNNEKDKVSQLTSLRHFRVRVFQKNFCSASTTHK